jgi:hypothetical protein
MMLSTLIGLEEHAIGRSILLAEHKKTGCCGIIVDLFQTNEVEVRDPLLRKTISSCNPLYSLDVTDLAEAECLTFLLPNGTWAEFVRCDS